MFRVNRIGTPFIRTTSLVTNTDALAPNENVASLQAITGNVINASPEADFGSMDFSWANAGPTVIQAGYKWALLHQFTITQPLAGDTVGVEVQGTINIRNDAYVARPTIVPIFTKLIAAGGATLAAVTGVYGTRFGPQYSADVPIAATTQWQAHSYKEQIILTDSATLEGTYAHGLLMYQNGAANLAMLAIHASMAVRQLNDQQNVSYRDTLR